jgi:hypothetical protein
LTDAEIADLVRIQAGDIASGKNNPAATRSLDTGDGADQRRLAGAVGADDGHDLVLEYFKRNGRKGWRVAIEQIEVFHFEQWGHSSKSSPR